MYTTINTVLICLTVLYCLRELLKRYDAYTNRPVNTELTDDDVEAAYKEAERNNELPADFADVIHELLQDFE